MAIGTTFSVADRRHRRALARQALGLGGAVAFGVFGYVLAMAAPTLLPETHGREIRALA